MRIIYFLFILILFSTPALADTMNPVSTILSFVTIMTLFLLVLGALVALIVVIVQKRRKIK